jgi:hypothetical protein
MSLPSPSDAPAGEAAGLVIPGGGVGAGASTRGRVLACFNPLWPNLNFAVAYFATEGLRQVADDPWADCYGSTGRSHEEQ